MTHQQSTTIGGHRIDYEAKWHSLRLDSAGTTISATSYVANGTAFTPASRPVAFVFNGGPGASSSPLHFTAFGPRILPSAGPAYWTESEMLPNEASLLDVSDLVFVDPVGTGFNRTEEPGADAQYLSIEGDAGAAERFIRYWLQENKREDSPLILVGQSYGGLRVATLGPQLVDLRLDRIVLISPLLDVSASSNAVGNDLRFIFDLPTMALTEWHHGLADSAEGDGKDPAKVWESARVFAQGEYAAALQLGSDLDESRTHVIAKELSRLLGVTEKEAIDAKLRIDSEQFLQGSLRHGGLLVGRLDTRVTGPIPPPLVGDRPPAADDPSLGIGRSNVVTSAAIGTYLRDVVQAPVGDTEYRSLNLELNFRFDWRPDGIRQDFYRNPTTRLAELLRQRPEAQITVVGGLFDLSTPWLAVRYALAHAGLDGERLHLVPLAGGHSIERTELASVSARLRRFLA
ncbi:hypothetical protein ACFRJ9_01870 [Paenarthrobacter sp. NPDC056912]|uniref:S10 family serine carboxypeptidase-like protein n=1 Tax=Paenarthrobacter sp. NPDC056912 TaxID=3345965 RepID=UPI003671FB26